MTTDTLALGLTAVQFVELLHTDKAHAAMKALQYLDGQQETEMIKLLNDPYKGRRNWKTRGIIPRTRNLVQMVITKSGQLFKDSAPVFEIFKDKSSTPDDALTTLFNDEMYKTEFQEFFINVDQVVRLLKTAIVLQQYDAASDQLIFDLLHRGNAQVILNPTTRAIAAIIYRTSDHGTYRVITVDEFIDLQTEETAGKINVAITAQEPNPYGIVPVSVFYDTNLPRIGFWCEANSDLVGINELVNLHITDAEYAISWAKLPTLFMIDCEVSGNTTIMEVQEVPGQALPRNRPMEGLSLGGPSEAIALTSSGAGTPSVQYLSPDVNIAPLDSVVDGWIKSYAADWSVRIKTAGEGNASSGFQLVVEEIPNMELRQMRMRMFEGAFKRFYKTFASVISAAKGIAPFGTNTELFAVFSTPSLPVDSKSDEEVWSIRIDSGRATLVDYFMEAKGMTMEEAEIKVAEIAATRTSKNPLNAAIELHEGHIDGTVPTSASSQNDMMDMMKSAAGMPKMK